MLFLLIKTINFYFIKERKKNQKKITLIIAQFFYQIQFTNLMEQKQ